MTAIRAAVPGDEQLVLDFITRLAEYEKMADQVVASPEQLAVELFENHSAEVIFAVDGGEEVGFALFFPNFSTFLGRPGLHLEDLFVLPEHRGRGHGKALFQALARIAVERGWGRFEWSCLTWNTPSLEFYRAMGAQTLDEWTTLRITGPGLTTLAGVE